MLNLSHNPHQLSLLLPSPHHTLHPGPQHLPLPNPSRRRLRSSHNQYENRTHHPPHPGHHLPVRVGGCRMEDLCKVGEISQAYGVLGNVPCPDRRICADGG